MGSRKMLWWRRWGGGRGGQGGVGRSFQLGNKRNWDPGQGAGLGMGSTLGVLIWGRITFFRRLCNDLKNGHPNIVKSYIRSAFTFDSGDLLVDALQWRWCPTPAPPIAAGPNRAQIGARPKITDLKRAHSSNFTTIRFGQIQMSAHPPVVRNYSRKRRTSGLYAYSIGEQCGGRMEGLGGGRGPGHEADLEDGGEGEIGGPRRPLVEEVPWKAGRWLAGCDRTDNWSPTRLTRLNRLPSKGG